MHFFKFSEDTIKELNRSMFNLYRFFSTLCSNAQHIEIDDDDWSTTSEIEFSLSPHSHYRFVYESASVFIHYHRDGSYSLDCRNIIPTTLKPHSRRVRSSDYRYQNYYGTFKDLSSAVDAFSSFVKAILSDKQGVFF